MNSSTLLRPQSLPVMGAVSSSNRSQWALGLILLVHVAATCVVLPPGDIFRGDPLLVRDHSVHTHRVQLYRDSLFAGGWPWGYDPSVSAGFAMDPGNDVGAKPQEVLGVLLFFLNPGTIERIFVFLVVLTIPLWMLLTCRRLRLPLEAQICVLTTLLIPVWLYDNLPRFVIWGMVAFAASSYFSPLVVALFLDFIDHPNFKRYLYLCLGASSLFLFHVLGPVVLVLPFFLVTMMASHLSLRWRLAVFGVPVIVFALNAFWAVPFASSFLGIPDTPVPTELDLTNFAHLDKPHATYDSMGEIASLFSPIRVIALVGGLFGAIFGFVVMKQMVGARAAYAFGFAGVFGIGLKFFGSFIPGVVLMQPARFILPTFVLLSIPMGLAFFRISQKARVAPVVAALVLVFGGFVSAVVLEKPSSLASTSESKMLVDFVNSRIAPSERLLIQSMAWEPRALPMLLHREVIGNSFPFSNDPSQFFPTMLWGKPIPDWAPEEMQEILQRWGISWCFAHNKQGIALFENVTKSSGEQIGQYRAFKISDPKNRFLVGAGKINAKVNHIELSELQPENGLVVLRYRYHPAWETSSGIPVVQYPIPEDPRGFIALKTPKSSESLAFNSLKMLSAPWPQSEK